MILRFHHLERLVLVLGTGLEIPPAIGDLRKLRLLYLSGVKRLPQEVLQLDLPISLERTSTLDEVLQLFTDAQRSLRGRLPRRLLDDRSKDESDSPVLDIS